MSKNFAKEISDALNEYADFSAEVLQEVIDKTAKETVKELKKTSPKRTGKYAQSWKQKTLKATPLSLDKIVYTGKPGYSMTHLLEKGHAKRGGGRVPGYPHIAKAERNAQDRIMQELKRKL